MLGGLVCSAVNLATSNPTEFSNSSMSALDDVRSNLDHVGINSYDWIKHCVQTICWGSPRQFLPKLVLVFWDFEIFKTHLPFLIAGILKEFVAGGLRHVRALRRETAVKGQGLSCVIG
jgi:hypothetical protein